MIKAYAEMVVGDITHNDKNKRTENLNVIIEETDRLNILVNDYRIIQNTNRIYRTRKRRIRFNQIIRINC